MQSIALYSVWMWENTDKKNSEYGHFLLSETLIAEAYLKFCLMSNFYEEILFENG